MFKKVSLFIISFSVALNAFGAQKDQTEYGEATINIGLTVMVSKTDPGRFSQLAGKHLSQPKYHSYPIESNKPLKASLEDALNKEKYEWLKRDLPESDIKEVVFKVTKVRFLHAESVGQGVFLDTDKQPGQFQQTPAALKAETWTYANAYGLSNAGLATITVSLQ